MQDTFIYLWVNRDKIVYTGSVYAYLCRAVKNSCIDYKLHEEVDVYKRQLFEPEVRLFSVRLRFFRRIRVVD